jgi:alkanesulfonate monooxygenase SsuD/methylene tetrahydromethanopterin reductase-like flavin-dependent oxidoreductase (luciferase family)
LFATGAGPERLAWAIDTARDARTAAGLDPAAFPFGASFPLFVHPDQGRARDLGSGTVASFAHLATVLGPVVGPVSDGQRDALTTLRNTYDVDRHLAHGSPQSRALTDDLIDTFAVAGPVSCCAERILELRELGISKFVFFSTVTRIRAGHRMGHIAQHTIE